MSNGSGAIEFDLVDYSKILEHDSRYDSRAYDLVVYAVTAAAEKKGKAENSKSPIKHATAEDVMMMFREVVLDCYGPMSMTVLNDFGIHSTEDIGEIMKNLCSAKFIAKSETDSFDDFVGGFNFTEAFVWPFEI
jgi:uncharacterized repeat protein (TIGR04138 family)